MKQLFYFILSTFYCIAAFGQQATAPQKPFVLGQIDEIQSKVLGEKRTLNIYLPDDYNPKDSIKYPVIYLLDGSADEDFIHIAGLVQFCSFEWVNQCPKSIVVGIATVDRRRDFTTPSSIEDERKKFPTTGHSDKFIGFLETELQPFIDKKYKTNVSKTIIGESLGGLLATEILFKKPNLFTQYIIVSPSLWWDNAAMLNQNLDILDKKTNQKTNIYIGVGKEGLAPTKIPHVMEVDANVLADKLKNAKNKQLQVIFDYLPQENHATIMHQAVFNAFKQLNLLAK